MKTMYLCLAGVFVLGGSMIFEGTESLTRLLTPTSQERISLIAQDTVPNKTVYRDLNTGETIDIWYDAVGIRTLNKKTGAPVEFYINTTTNDTVFGRGRFVVNSYVVKGEDGKWKLDDAKVKVDGDELKVKVGDQKFKIDGDEVKIKGKGGKAKYEDDKTKVKVKDSTKSEK